MYTYKISYAIFIWQHLKHWIHKDKKKKIEKKFFGRKKNSFHFIWDKKLYLKWKPFHESHQNYQKISYRIQWVCKINIWKIYKKFSIYFLCLSNFWKQEIENIFTVMAEVKKFSSFPNSVFLKQDFFNNMKLLHSWLNNLEWFLGDYIHFYKTKY